MERRSFFGSALAALGGLFGVAAASNAARSPVCHRGYGPCKYRNCDCYKFGGKSNTCKCGHSFYDHR